MPAFDITGSVDVRKVIRVQKIKQHMIHEESCTLQKRPYVCVLITALVCWLRTRECRYMQLMQKVQCILGPEFGSEERRTNRRSRDSGGASLRCAYEMNCGRERDFPNKDMPKVYVNAYGKSNSFRYLRIY